MRALRGVLLAVSSDVKTAILVPLSLTVLLMISFHASATGMLTQTWSAVGVREAAVWDPVLAVAGLGLAASLVVLFRLRGSDWWRTAFSTLVCVSAVGVTLPVQIYLWDFKEFQLHVTWAQVGTSLAWFTNADLLVCLGLAIAMGLPALRVKSNRASYLFIASAVLLAVLITLYALSLTFAPPTGPKVGSRQIGI